jgi:hypothetical protein
MVPEFDCAITGILCRNEKRPSIDGLLGFHRALHVELSARNGSLHKNYVNYRCYS